MLEGKEEKGEELPVPLVEVDDGERTKEHELYLEHVRNDIFNRGP